MSALTPLPRIGRIAAPRPNWRESVSVEYEFQTDIITAHNGNEDRAALRERARVAVTYVTLADGATLRRHMADLEESQSEPFILPTPWKRALLAANYVSGAGTVTLSHTPSWLVAGARLVLTDGTFEVAVQVASVAGSVATLVAPAARSFTAGSYAVHAYSARSDESVEFTAETDRLFTANLRWEVDPGSDPQGMPSATPATFEGFEVLLTRPNWASRPKITIAELRREMGGLRGTIFVESPTRRANLQMDLGYTGMSEAQIEALVAFFCRMKGQRGEFWTPSWVDDLEVKTGISAGATTFLTEGDDSFYGFDQSDIYRAVIAFWPDGGFQINRVNSITLLGSDSRFNFAAPWAQAITPSTRIGWALRARFDTDSLNVRYRTATVAETDFRLTTVSARAT